MSLFSQNEMIKVVSAKIILGENFLREDFHRGNYSSPGNYFVTFHWGKFSPFIFESNHFLIFFIAFSIINQSIITTGTTGLMWQFQWVVEMYKHLREQKDPLIKGFQKSGIMSSLSRTFTQDARTLLTIGLENWRLIIDCLYSLCKRGTAY